MAEVLITEFTDPGCPWAYSAEPFRWRLNWLYGDRIEWQLRMVVLAEDPGGHRGARLRHEADVGRLQDDRARARHADRHLRAPADGGPLPACRRWSRPGCTRRAGTALLRALRIRNFAGELLDDPATIAGAALDAGLDPDGLERGCAGEDVTAAVEEDKALARAPMPAARVLDHKLANWSGGRRYTCPSYEIVRLATACGSPCPAFSPSPSTT